MNGILQGLMWATAIIFMAVAEQYGAISPDAGRLLLVILPAAAFLSIYRTQRCCFGQRAGAGQ